MVTFGLPQALWSLLTIPVILLLHMLRARREARTVSSTLLWERTARDLRARMPVRRLERSLLLLLQILAATLLALALARPALTVEGVAGSALVLVFDTSLSMQARDVGSMQARDVTPTRFGAAQAEALRLIDRLGRGRSVMIIEAGAGPRVVTEFTADRLALARAVRRMRPTDGPSDLDAAIRVAAAQRVRGRPAQTVVFTDRPGLQLARVVYRPLGGSADNVAITRAAAGTSGGGRTYLLTEVRNFGGAARTAALRVTWPDGTAEVARVTIPREGSVTRVWTARGDGAARIAVEAGDILPADDEAVVLVGQASRPRVLLVSGGNPFLEAVLSVLPVRQVDQTARVDPAAWAGYDLIVLDRTPPLVLPPGRYLLVGTVPENLPVDVEGRTRNVTVLRSVDAHPVLRLVDLAGVRVDEALSLRPRGGTVLAEGTVPLVWVIERPDIQAVVLPFDLLRSDLPVHPAFPLWMANVLEWLHPATVIPAGGTLLVPAGAGDRVQLIDPAGRGHPVAVSGGVAALPRFERAGLYVLKVGSKERRIVVAPATATESDLRQTPPPAGAAPSDVGLRQHALWFPLLLAALAILLLEWLLWLRTAPAPMLLARHRVRRPLLLLRLAVVGLLILSLTGLEIARGGRDLAVVFALDLSDSVPPWERQRGLDLMQAAARDARAGDRFGLVTFGADAMVAEGLVEDPQFPLAPRPGGHRTDIGRGIRTALGLLPPEGARRIVVLTDGHDTEGQAGEAALLAAAAGVELGVVSLGSTGGNEARIDILQAPREVRVGERFQVQVWTEASQAARGVLRLLAGGREVWSGAVSLREGRTLLSIPQRAITPGTVTYEARLDVTPDELDENNRAYGIVQVMGAAPVLYVGGGGGALPRWLRAQGLDIHEIAPETLPAEAAALAGVPVVVLDDVPATALSPAQRRALREYVSALGGGLVVVGGPHAFGVGGYAGTDLEAVLPLSMDVRHRVAIPSMAVVLVVDASGSMASFGPEIAKVELAKEAAQSVIDLLGERDLIGVIAFDQEPHWLVHLSEARHREQILTQVSRISAGGGTNLHPALQEAFRALEGAQAKVKHVIILSDGQTDPGDFARLVRRMARAKVTVSSVAIGRDADHEIMRDLASWGRGRYYFTRDLYTIPQIVTAEAVLATRAYLIEERFRPLVAPGSSLLRDIDPLPALRGYVATAPKPAATLHALSPQGDPLLASWQYGLGRAVAFTSDAAARWAVEWFAWPDAARFWSRLVRWAMSPPTDPLDVHAAVERDQVHLVLDARDQDGALLLDLTARAEIVGQAGEPVTLSQTAPGRYEGRVPVRSPGGYLVSVAASRGDRLVGVGRAAVAVGYSPELRTVGANTAGLARLVEVAGARPIETSAEILQPPARGSRRSQPAWPPMTAVALGLFVVEVTLRRVPVISEVTRRALAHLVAWVRREPPKPQPEDREYEAADQWPATDEGLAARSADMEQAARLYIARLRRQQESDRKGE